MRETLANYGTAIVTNNGGPVALMVQIGKDENPLELEQAIRLMLARMAISSIRKEHQKRRFLKQRFSVRSKLYTQNGK